MENRKEHISKQRFYRVLFVGWSLIILFFTLSPKGLNPIPIIDIPHFDKVGHFGMFFILAALLFLGLHGRKEMTTWLIIILYCAFLGGLTEFLQTKIEGRSADILDFLADILGCICGLFLVSNINFQPRD